MASNVTRATASAAVNLARPIRSQTLDEARRGVRHVYKAWYSKAYFLLSSAKFQATRISLLGRLSTPLGYSNA